MGDVAGMKVALVLATSAGGVGRHVRSVARGLAEQGVRVVVCGPAATEETFGFAGDGVRFAEVEISDRPRPWGDVRAVGRLRALVKGADVVHAHGLRAGGLAVLARGAIVPGMRVSAEGPPVVVTLHNAVLAGGAIGLAYAGLERIVAKGASCVLGVSPDLEERMRALGAKKVGHAIVPSPAHGEMPGASVRQELRDELGAEDRTLLLTVGRLAEQKGLLDLLEAAEALKARSPLFVIAGDGPLEGMLRERIAAEDLPVRLLGRRNDVPSLLAACDVVVVPSIWEGQPLFVQEALKAGRPLVATRVGGIPDMVGEAAMLVPAGDPKALTEAIGTILEDPGLVVRLAAGAAQRATSLPGETDAVEQLIGVYRGIVTDM